LRVKEKKNLGKGEKTHNTAPTPQTSTSKQKIKLVEGAILQERDREIHQRNPKLRQLCIEAYGNEYRCVVCGMNFVDAYGEIGKEFIEVHHLYPISETDGEHEVNPATDMIPLCSNCHSMIHRMEDKSDWKKLKELYEQNT
jgi:predicted HNH restriction endonuclease